MTEATVTRKRAPRAKKAETVHTQGEDIAIKAKPTRKRAPRKRASEPTGGPEAKRQPRVIVDTSDDVPMVFGRVNRDGRRTTRAQRRSDSLYQLAGLQREARRATFLARYGR